MNSAIRRLNKQAKRVSRRGSGNRRVPQRVIHASTISIRLEGK